MKISVDKSFESIKQLSGDRFLFADGGVVGKNKLGSAVAGTYAWCVVNDHDITTQSGSGVLLPEQVSPCEISNNTTEFYAVISGLRQLNASWSGTVCSDSKIALGRIFCGWSCSNVPSWMIELLQDQKRRLIFFDKFQYCLLSGHPNKQELNSGLGKSGYPVSKHNVWCDKQCESLGRDFMRKRDQK